jgi:hypothetical protein
METTLASTSLQVYDTATRSIFVAKDKSVILASSTLSYLGNYSAAGTTTIIIANHTRPITLLNYFCVTDNAGKAWVAIGTGAATTTYVQAASAGASAITASNNTWTARQNFIIAIGNQTSNPNYITCTFSTRDDAD